MSYLYQVKIFNPSGGKVSWVVYAVLLITAGGLILIIIFGTIIGLIRWGREPVLTLGKPAQTSNMINAGAADDIRIYTGLGRLRIPLADSSILILSVVFPYSASDTAFMEELAAKVNDFRTLAGGYFQSLPVEAALQIDEETAKQEILKSFNANLRLGSIKNIYFEDLMVLEGGF